MKGPELYTAAPAVEPALDDCSFYQTIVLPGLGVIPGQWDLRPGIAEYLGEFNFTSKRVLEVGTANGFVCFEMERRGADVVSFDLAEKLTYDAPPLSQEYLCQETYRQGLRRIRNAFWLAHSRLKSSAKVVYGHANRLPLGLNGFDVGVIANVLQHLQDPIGAIMQLADRCQSVIVTEADWMRGHADDLKGMIYFDKDDPYVWYQVKPPLVEAVLGKMGFKTFSMNWHTQLFVENCRHDPSKGGAVGVAVGLQVPHYTIVAAR
jgi:SAM-dependent methyltransferase